MPVAALVDGLNRVLAGPDKRVRRADDVRGPATGQIERPSVTEVTRDDLRTSLLERLRPLAAPRQHTNPVAARQQPAGDGATQDTGAPGHQNHDEIAVQSAVPSA